MVLPDVWWCSTGFPFDRREEPIEFCSCPVRGSSHPKSSDDARRALLRPHLLALGVLALATCQPPAELPDDAEADTVAEVTAFLDSYRAALDGRDTLRLASFYLDDGRFVWLEDGEVRYRSADEVAASLSSLPEGMVVSTDYDETVIEPVGADGASATMQFLTTIGEGPSAFEFGGVISMTLERGPEGWRIVTGHTSTASPEGQ